MATSDVLRAPRTVPASEFRSNIDAVLLDLSSRWHWHIQLWRKKIERVGGDKQKMIGEKEQWRGVFRFCCIVLLFTFCLLISRRFASDCAAREYGEAVHVALGRRGLCAQGAGRPAVGGERRPAWRYAACAADVAAAGRVIILLRLLRPRCPELRRLPRIPGSGTPESWWFASPWPSCPDWCSRRRTARR